MALFIKDSFLKVSRSTRNFIVMFSDVYGRTFDESDQTRGVHKIGFSTTTTRHVTEHSSFANFSLRTTLHLFRTLPTRQIWRLRTSFSSRR